MFTLLENALSGLLNAKFDIMQTNTNDSVQYSELTKDKMQRIINTLVAIIKKN